MAQPIAARRPFLVKQNNTTFTLDIEAYLVSTPGNVSTYRLQKSSFDEGTPEDLSFNVSPFGKDLFDHKPLAVLPTDLAVSTEDYAARIDATPTSTAITQELEAYDGWLVLDDSVKLPISTQDSIRMITLNTKQYLTLNTLGVSTVEWSTDKGKLHTEVVPVPANRNIEHCPVLHPDLGATDTDRFITIRGKDGSNNVLWSLTYELVCSYETAYTIGFINRYGVWEFFDVVGRVDKDVTSTRERYVRFDNDLTAMYNVNGHRQFLFNTGLVDDAFNQVLEDMLMSENLIVYTGDINTSVKLNLLSESLQMINGRADKIGSYELNVQEAGQIISNFDQNEGTIVGVQSF